MLRNPIASLLYHKVRPLMQGALLEFDPTPVFTHFRLIDF